MTSIENQYLTAVLAAQLPVKKLAGLLGVSISTVWRWTTNPEMGFPQPRRFGRRATRWDAAEIDAWIRDHREGAE